MTIDFNLYFSSFLTTSLVSYGPRLPPVIIDPRSSPSPEYVTLPAEDCFTPSLVIKFIQRLVNVYVFVYSSYSVAF
ncbi:hypothetical protein AB3S75_010690 [Citrus x aurantiifolia]